MLTVTRSTALIFFVVLLGVMALSASADEGSASPQLVVARQNAVRSLHAQVSNLQIAPGLTVGSFLAQTKSADAIADLEAKAALLGGPRWIDDQTVQVKVELPGVDLVTQLVSLAATHPDGPIRPGVIEQRLQALKRVSLIGTGTSLKNLAVPLRPPGVNDPWAAVADADRGRAVNRARADAERRLLEESSTQPVTRDQTFGDLLRRSPVRESVQAWLSRRPVSDVRFKEDLQVEVSIVAPREELRQTFIAAARADGVTVDDAPVLLNNAVSPTVAATGWAAVGGDLSPPPAANAELLPDQPPLWTNQPIDAQGIGQHQARPLRTKSAAEAEATEALRAQIYALRVDQNRTVGDLTRSDPRIDTAVNFALLRAHVYKVEWRADGSVAVRITLESSGLWDDLVQAVAH